MKINPRHYILILLALASIGISVAGYFLIYNQTIFQAEHYVNANKELENENTKKQNDQDLVKIYDNSKDDRTKVSSFLVKEDKIVNFIEMVEKVGNDSHIDLELSSISNDDAKVKAQVNAKGSWSGILTALTMIENLPVSSTISNVKMNVAGSPVKGARDWSLSLDIEALMIK